MLSTNSLVNMRCACAALGAFLVIAVATLVQAKEISTGYALDVIGWSDDERYWAASESGNGCGACNANTVQFYVVDAQKNKFIKKLRKEFLNKEDCGGAQRGDEKDYYPTDEMIRAEKEYRLRTLKEIISLGFHDQKGIEVYKKPVAVWMDVDGNIKQYGEKKISFVLGNDRYGLSLEDKIINAEGWLGDAKSMFKILIRKNNGKWTTLQEDNASTRSYYQYRIIYVSIAPNKSKIAIVVEAIEYGFEGCKIPNYKIITGVIPRNSGDTILNCLSKKHIRCKEDFIKGPTH